MTDEIRSKVQATSRSQEASRARESLMRVDVPDSLRDNLALFLWLVRRVLNEYGPDLRMIFDRLLEHTIAASGEESPAAWDAYLSAVAQIDELEVEQMTLVTRAFAAYFHLANVCEENYRVHKLRERESVSADEVDETAEAANDLVRAYQRLEQECGPSKARVLLSRLRFHPVFTAHPTEARRKAVEGKIRRISVLLDQRPLMQGVDLAENERRLLQEIDALLRTSPIATSKPTPVEEAGTVIDIFDNTLFEMVPDVYRRFDDWELGERAGTVPPSCPAFFRLGSWIGSDRDGNPSVTAKVSRKVSERFRSHMLETLARETRRVGTNLTLDARFTRPSSKLVNLWNHQVEMSEALSARAEEKSASEPHRAVMLVMANRLEATIARTADIMYADADELLDDLRVVQDSLARAGAVREAYGPVQRLVWQVETFGFHLVEMEFRQHSLVHARALADIEEHGLSGERGSLAPETREVLDTFRAIGTIQRRNGEVAARRYIISFTTSAADVAGVYQLARHAFAHEADVPTLDVIPLFEQVEDLERAVDTLSEIIQLPEVRHRLDENGRHFEVMLGYSDSSKDAGPTAATFMLHAAQERIAAWARENYIDLTLMHGRGGAVGRGGGPANRAVLAQPKGSVNCRFKLTEQGEVIFARYGDPTLARRHIESVAGATLLQSAPSVEWTNTETSTEFLDLADRLSASSRERYLQLLETDGFPAWFAQVTPLAEIGLMPIGSRPARRGLGATSLADLRAIPWIFSWSQARVNLAAWYGLGTACERCGDLSLLRRAYEQWPLFATFVDNIEMSLAKTDERIARAYLSLGDRDDLRDVVLEEMALTRRWVLAIVGNDWPLQNHEVLGPVVRLRLPFVNVLSLTQVHALAELRYDGELTPEQRERLTYLILCSVSGVAAGLQNTG